MWHHRCSALTTADGFFLEPRASGWKGTRTSARRHRGGVADIWQRLSEESPEHILYGNNEMLNRLAGMPLWPSAEKPRCLLLVWACAVAWGRVAAGKSYCRKLQQILLSRSSPGPSHFQSSLRCGFPIDSVQLPAPHRTLGFKEQENRTEPHRRISNMNRTVGFPTFENRTEPHLGICDISKPHTEPRRRIYEYHSAEPRRRTHSIWKPHRAAP